MFGGINVKCVKCIWAQRSLFYVKCMFGLMGSLRYIHK